MELRDNNNYDARIFVASFIQPRTPEDLKKDRFRKNKEMKMGVHRSANRE
jgi:hypothetical protein